MLKAQRNFDDIPDSLPSPHGRRYPWAQWFRRTFFRLTKGKHFHGAPHGMAQMVRNRAAVEGLSVTVSILGDEVEVRVLGKAKRRKHR